MNARLDAHSPLNLVTEDYRYVGAYDNEDIFFQEDSRYLRDFLAHSTTARYGNGHQCDHCGAHIRYVAVLLHVPTQDHIAIGETCLGNRFALASRDFHTLRQQAANARKEHRLLTAWNEYKAEHPGVNFDLLATSENAFIKDVLAKGRQYGNLSDNQLNAIVRAFERDAQRAVEQAAQALVPKVDCPEGKRITITGRLVSRKWKETQFGSVEKCLVVVDTGAGEYKVWGSISQALRDQGVQVGDLVTFSANVERSSDDHSFGFFSRPTKAQVLSVPVDAPTPVVEQALADGWDPQTQVLDLEEVNLADYEPICGQLHAHNDTCYA
jgi:hypothetical protein